ncbi:DegV family protein [uncultured Anaerococcus sp.]|uniref:DegV family protein n=1 Tax=uncultured Anaerococcus sp. TaxID=293428 RepID=UPI00288B35E7|nr:DegV family protein [uncultured Anaerococcus sp.]
MEKIAILTDSTSDLIDKYKNKDHIFILPLYVNIDGSYLKDGIEITSDEVVEFNKNNPDNLAKSSAPSPGDCAHIIEEIRAKGYKKIIIISVSSKLSTTHNVFNHVLDDDMYLLDSRSASLMESLLVNYADDLINEGLSFEEICTRLNQIRDEKAAYIWVDTLENLVKGGRISAPLGKAVKFLNIKPMLKVASEGKVDLVKLRVKEDKAIDQVIKKVRSDLEGVKEYYLGLGFGGDKSLFEKIEDKASDLIKSAKSYHHNTFGSVLRVYSGEKAFALFYIRIK